MSTLVFHHLTEFCSYMYCSCVMISLINNYFVSTARKSLHLLFIYCSGGEGVALILKNSPIILNLAAVDASSAAAADIDRDGGAAV